MAKKDPHDAPDYESPIDKRLRLLTLNAPEQGQPPAAEPAQEKPASKASAKKET